MDKLYYDLHIHSCLSPCGADDMHPADIAGMAKLQGLDVFALTDHNTARNCAAALEAAAHYDILCLPGMELTTSEEVHVVCLLGSLEAALAFDQMVYRRLVPVPNDPEIFGRQIIRDVEGNAVGEEPMLLLNATDIDFDEVFQLTDSFGGVAIPAHCDRGANSLLANLGFVPPGAAFRTAEFRTSADLDRIRREHPYFDDCLIIHGSDAHNLMDLPPAAHTLAVRERSVQGVLDALREGKGTC